MFCHVYGNWDFSTSHKTARLNAAEIIYLCKWIEKNSFSQEKLFSEEENKLFV